VLNKIGTRKCVFFSFLQTIHIFNITMKTDFDRTDLRYWSLRDCEGGTVDDWSTTISASHSAHWYTFFISTRMYIPLPIHIRPSCRWIRRQKIAKESGIRSREGARSHWGNSELSRGKMVLSARDEIWIVCYNSRRYSTRGFWSRLCEHEKSFRWGDTSGGLIVDG